MIESDKIAVLLVDSECAVCTRSVRFIRKHIDSGTIVFRSLYSGEGKQYLKKYEFPQDYDKSLVYIFRGIAYVKSDAVLRITGQMKGLFPLLRGFLVVPRAIRDFFYDILAKHRHMIPVKEGNRLES